MKSLVPLLSLLLLTGCVYFEPNYVYVDAIAAERPQHEETYYLFSGMPWLREEDLQFKKYASFAHDALGDAGFSRVESPDVADLVVGYSYGVSSVREGNAIRRTSHVELAAFDWEDVRDHGDRNAIWRTQAYMDGSHGGLGRVLPMLLEASTPWLGENSGDIIEVVFD